MFVFLALVFAVGFVGFGIGANQNASIGDLLRGGGGTTDGSISVSDAREQVEKSPKSAQAQRNLATALQEDGQTDEAIVVLNRYLALRPKDKEALQELAGLHLGRANALARDAQEAQVRASYLTFGSTFSTPLDLGKGATLGPDPIDEAISTQANEAVNKAYTAAQASYQKAEDDVRPARRGRPERPERPARAGPGGTAERRHREGDRRLREVPEARSRRPDRADRQAADRAAEGRADPATSRVRLTRDREDNAHSVGETGGIQMNFDVKTEKLSNEQYVISLAGEVDLYTAPEFKQQLLEVIDQGGRDVIVDLSDTTFIDSTTLGVLVGGVKRLRTNEGQLSLVCSDRNITKIFEITGLDRVFTIHPTREAAVGAESPTTGSAA